MTTTADDLLTLAVRVATSAGKLVDDGRRRGVHHAATKSSATDMVTEWDRASERHIVEQLALHRPDDGMVGEEGSAKPSRSGIEWLIDPIDGTTNFLYDLPTYAVSIGAGDGDGPLVGVVHLPGLGWTFAARRGAGATLNGEAISCTDTTDTATALVATGFAYDVERRRFQSARIAHLLPQIRDIRRFGAASVDLCLVACGRVDAYFEEGLGPWDIAAGALIAAEAGARVTALDGGPLQTRAAAPISVLAAGTGIHGALHALIARSAGKM